MARKARTQSSAASAADGKSSATRKPSGRSRQKREAAILPKDRIVDALVGLLATRSFDAVGLADIAEEAGMSLGELRETYDGKFAMLSDFSRRIDRIVLDGGPAEGETARDRLFEILMRRFDALEPYKSAIRSVTRAARCDLCLMRVLRHNALRSAQWMLVAADAEKKGLLAAMALGGLAMVNAEALRTWLDEDDPGLAKTMATLDGGLARGARAMTIADGVCARFRKCVSRDRATRSDPAAA